MRYNLSNLSKYRAQIMGIATIFIILCHSANPFSNHICRDLYDIYVNRLLQCGVDIFLLLSGLGCYFSFSKNPSLKSFYIKRATRIFAPFIIFVAIYGVVSVLFLKTDIMEYLYRYSIVSFFISGDWGIWFVGAILVLYIMFPFVFYILNKEEKLLLTLIVLVIGIVIMPFWKHLSEPLQIIKGIFICRIPVFMFGTWIGKKIYNKESLSVNKYICFGILMLSLIAFTINVKYNKSYIWLYSRLIFFPLSFSISIIIANLFEKWNIKKLEVNRILLFVGALSFETYLVFERVLGIVLRYTSSFVRVFRFDFIAFVAINIFSAAITAIIALLIHKLSDKLILLIKEKQ